jgi:hypothetical protein
MLRAGCSKVDITPSREQFMAGFGRNRRSTGIHDNLYVRTLALELDGESVYISSLDLIGLFRETVMNVRKKVKDELGTRDEQVIIASTHNHQGPDTLGLWGPSDHESGIDPSYMSYLAERTVQSVAEAHCNARKATTRAGSVLLNPKSIAYNARDANSVDRQLTVLKFEDSQHNCISTIVNFAIHPEALGNSNTLISADLVGFIHEGVESSVGGTSILLNGALGGMVTPAVKENSFEEARRVGLEISTYVLRALENARTVPLEVIRIASSEVKARLENRLFAKAAEMGLIQRETNLGMVASEVGLVEFGNEIGIVMIPGEPLPRLGLEIKALMPYRHKLLVSLANDELGYIIPEDQWDPSKYEESMSVGPSVAPTIESKIEELIDSVATYAR